jgi:hypothetical protein
MVADLGSYKYGIPENGKIVGGSEHDYDTKWKLQSPEEFEKNGGGICYDYVEFEEGYLDAYGIKCKKYFMSTNLPGNDTHTFILVDDGKGGFIYPESSFEKVAGTHEVKSVEEAIKIVADGFWKINDNINKVNEFKYYVWEFTGHPKYGSSIQKCIEYYSKGEPFFESNCLRPKNINEYHTDLSDETFYRYEYEGEGIYEALRKKMTNEEWKKFKNSSAATWLPVPPKYSSGDVSYFTAKGKTKFLRMTYPTIIRYLDKSKIRDWESKLNPEYIRYRDEYQIVFNKTKKPGKSQPIREFVTHFRNT